MSEETKTNEPVKQEGDFKLKKKRVPKKLTVPQETVKIDLEAVKKTGEPVKIDLTKKENKDAVQEQKAEESVLRKEGSEVGLQEVGQTHEGTTENVIEEIPITEEDKKKEIEQKVEETKPVEQPVKQLPENVEKLVTFMEETGGTVEDYVRLNADYSKVNDDVLLKEYYKQTKPHLNDEEVSFIMEENFSYDDDVDEQRDIKKKQLAKKEAIAEAKDFLEELKEQYYDEIKLRPGINQEQQKALDFFNRYSQEQEIATQRHETFVNDTRQLFTDEFKGFDFEVGEKKFRYGVKDPSSIAENQSNINNFVERFLDNEGNVKDTKGYHKAMYAAQNIDKIVNHFYEQGKTDGIKTVMDNSKNPTTATRETAGGDIFIGGLKVKAIDGVDSSKLRIKRSKFNN